MKILYGVVGEGMGHAIRSQVILDHLVAAGHEVHVMASSRAADFLSRRFSAVHRIHGLHIIARDNRVHKGKTLLSNVIAGTLALPRQLSAYADLLEAFAPQLVISDFESWSYFYAKAHRVPVFSIDNMQIVNRCTHDADILEGQRTNFEIARTFIKSKLPGCDHYFISTFFYPPVRRERTSLHPPILRREILEAKPERGDHLVVYQTAEGYRSLAQALQGTGLECRIYGMRRALEEEEVVGKLRYRPFSETHFIEDLRTARAVIGGGGFTTMGECVYLHKPMLSIPIEGQFEQILNARYLEREGFGRYASEVTPAVLDSFLERLDEYENKLSHYGQDDNRSIFEALDRAIASIAH